MILMVSPSPIAVISILSILVGSISVSHSYFVSNVCGSNGNYTSNSVYNINLYRALKRLNSTTNTSNSGFYNVSVGENLDMVNTLVLCRGDVQHNICRSCVQDTIKKLRELCPNQKEAVVWYDECMLRYSHDPVLNNSVTVPTKSLLKVNNASDMVKFDKGRRDLLDELREQAIERKFATGNISGPDFGTIYGLMQCTPDLSLNDCHDCLDGLMSGISSGNIGGQLMNPSCRLRFETARFYNETTIVDAPPPMSELLPPPSSLPPPDKKDNTVRTVLIIVAGSVGFLILLLVILIYIYRRKRKQLTATRALTNDNVEDIRNVESLQYSFATIDAATNHFSDSNKLGQGGFGIVYKGILKSGQEVAVKRLSQGSGQGEQEFKNEVLLVAQLQHRNLARLLGFCYKRAERLLIYEFVPNASLDQFIFDSTKSSFLNWETRYKIIGGVARGLLYLHEDSRLRIIHRDLKPSNVLLDEDMNPKISDFGMARLCGINETQGNTSRVVGTYGYMAPEYAMYGEFSVKSDVFSFGVLILEIVSGQKTNCFRNGMNIEDLTSAVWKNWQEGSACNVIDPILKNSSESIQEITRCIHIGLLCVQENVTKRPTMASVMHMLNSFSLTLALPSEPAFLMHSRIDTLESWSEDAFSSSMNDTSSKARDKSTDNSVNNASASDVYPR